MLWCLDRKSDRYHTFTKAHGYTISVLGTAHESVSSRLAKQGAHHLDGIELLPTELGPPALADALAIFECAAEAAYEGGDHAILVGRVLRFARRDIGEPLVFFRGRLRRAGNVAGLTEQRVCSQNRDGGVSPSCYALRADEIKPLKNNVIILESTIGEYLAAYNNAAYIISA